MVEVLADPEVLNNLGLALCKNKNYTDAWFAFEHALKLNPSDLNLVKNYLLCILESGDINKFEAMFKKAKFLPPEEYRNMKRISLEYKNAMGYLDNNKAVKNTNFGFKSIVLKK